MKRPYKLALFFISLISFSAFAHGEMYFSDFFGIKISDSQSLNLKFPRDLKKTNLQIAKWTEAHPYKWTGSISINFGENKSNCSGSVFALDNYSPDDKVLVLSAGHCLMVNPGLTLPKTAFVNFPMPAENKLISLYLNFANPRQYIDDNGAHHNIKKVPFRKAIFAAMDYTDVAIFETDLTYKQLVFPPGQRPRRLRSIQFEKKQKLKSIGVPRNSRLHLNKYTESNCKAKHQKRWDFTMYELGPLASKNSTPKPLMSNDEKYVIADSTAFNCTVMHSLSGGPVLDHEGYIVGVNAGASKKERASYFTNLNLILSCVDDDRFFNTSCLNELKENIENRIKPNYIDL